MAKKTKLITTHSPEQTIALARRLGKHAPAGAVIAAYGELGVGKTCFATGLARGLGIDEAIISPTYVYFYIYPGDKPFAHIDAYRLDGLEEEEIALIGIEDCFAKENVVFVEWPGFIAPWLPKDHVALYIEQGSEDYDRLFELVYDSATQGWIDEAISY